jgi:hypothetical protein
LKAAIGAIHATLLATILLFSSFDYKFAHGQDQQQLQNYQNPTLGIRIQYPLDWQVEEEEGEQVTFVKENDMVEFLVDVHESDPSDRTLTELVDNEITNKKEQREGFKLIESTPTTISGNPAHELLYTFVKEDGPRAGEINKVMRIFTIKDAKLYTVAYLSEPEKFPDYLTLVERMVDSFRIDTGSTSPGGSTTQIQSSDRGREDNNGGGNCDRISYPDPDACIPPYPPDLNCGDIPYKNFEVAGSDPHGFDRDNDGVGCESANGVGVTPPDNGDRTPPDNGNGNCDPSYPAVCIESPPPDLNCGDIPYKNFEVAGSDPHGFDRDNDGVGCESANGEVTPTPTPTPTPEPEPCEEGFETGAGGQCVPIPCYFGGDWPCPPCPEGVEGDRCADRDELLDFDCSDEGMETDPRCLNGDRHPCYPDPTVPECLALSPNPTPTPTANIQNEEPTLFGSPTSTPTPVPTPTSPIDPNLLARSQPQSQCEFGINSETGLCNTEDVTSEPVPPTPEPTTTPDGDFSIEEETEEAEDEPEEEIIDEPEDEPEGNGESNEDNTTE